MDAISFVLGVQAVSLRGTRLSDLIYRPEGELLSDQEREATVTLVYIDDKENEVKLSRSISPNGGSDYRINGKKVTYDEFDKRLKSYGILVKARNFLVFQGDVEAMAQKKGKELAEMFEIISGSDELRASYDELKQAKADTDDGLIHASSKTKTLRAEKKVVKEQKKEGERYDELMEKEQEVKTRHLLWQLFNIESDVRESVGQCTTIESDIAEATEVLQKSEEAFKEKNQDRAKYNRQEKQQQKKLEDIRKAIQKLQPQCIEKEEKITHAEGKAKTARDKLKKLNKSTEVQTKLVNRFTSELDELEKAAAEFETEASANESTGLELGTNQREKYEKIKQKSGVATAKLRTQLKDLQRVRNVEEKAYDGLNSDMEQLVEKKKKAEDGNTQLSERMEQLNVDIQEQQEKLDEKQKSLSSFSAQKDDLKKKETKLQERIYRSEEVLQDAKADKRESKNESRSRESLDTLQRLFPGVKGRVIDLCKISDRKYNLAVTVTMGKDMDSVVVDTKETAMQCIEYLKTTGLGRMTFIPLDVDAKPINDTLRRQCANTAHRKLAIDVIRFDNSLDAVLRYTCGNTVICPDMNDARKLCFDGQTRVKAVTLNGTIIAKNGNMSGGQSDNEARAARWEAKEVEALKAKRDKWRNELNEIQAGGNFHEKETNMSSEISSIRSRIKMLENDQILNEEKLKKGHENVKHILKEIKKLKPGHEESKKKLEKQKEKIQESEQEIGNIEEKLFKDFSEEVGVSNIRDYEETMLAQVKAQQEKRLKFSKNIEKLKNQLELEKSRDRSDEKQKLVDHMQKEQDALDKLVSELKKCTDEIEKLEVSRDEVKGQAGEQDSETKEMEAQLKTLRSEVDENKSAVNSLKKKLAGLENATEQLRAQRLDHVVESKVEEIVLPTCEGEPSGRVDPSTTKRRRVSSGGKADEDRDFNASEAFNMSRDDPNAKELSIDFSSLEEEERKAQSHSAQEQVKEQYREELKGILLEQERISPNVRALEKFADVEGRLKSVVDEFEVAKTAAEEASKKFDEVRKERYDLFMKAFEHVSACIDGIYKNLTSTASNPQGGTAVLTLENEDEPYLHGVRFYPQPPYKGFRDIEQLSGGEKSIAALALLFAIHSFHPSPFFVLDEVDAALDANNVKQVTNYIKSRKKDFQSIVISLKDQFYENADVLVGVARDKPKESSAVYTLDLCAYDSAAATATA